MQIGMPYKVPKQCTLVMPVGKAGEARLQMPAGQ